MSNAQLPRREFEIGPSIAPVEYGLVCAHALASLGGLFIAGLFGLIVAA